ncbi:hypothetical protein ACH4NF_31395 [Streptomyces sp. NPDC017248]|uniref:hypothetical protein n=1 Tax=unclassified Streptomyces TaxID=2593676 RepID=UPI0037B39903
MPTRAVPGPDLPPVWAAEPKRDGCCARLVRRGDMTAACPEIRAAALAQLPEQLGGW